MQSPKTELEELLSNSLPSFQLTLYSQQKWVIKYTDKQLYSAVGAGQRGSKGNETAYRLAKIGFEHPLV
jgi:hypothetical protein